MRIFTLLVLFFSIESFSNANSKCIQIYNQPQIAFNQRNSSLRSNLNSNLTNYRELGETYASQLLTATQQSPLSTIYILESALSRIKSTMKMSDDKLISTGNQKFDSESARIKQIEEIIDRVIQRNKNIDGILESIKSEKNKWNLFKRGQSSSAFEKLKDELTLLIADLRRLTSYEEFLTSLSHYLEQSKNEYEIRVQEAKMDLEYVSGFTDYILFNSSHFPRNQMELTNSFELFSSLASESRSKVYKSESELTLLNSRIGILDKTKVMLSLLKEISNIDNYIQVSGLTDPDKIQKLKEISLKSISVGEEIKKSELESIKYSQNIVSGNNLTYSFDGKAFNRNSFLPESTHLINGMKPQLLEPWKIKNKSIFYTEPLTNDFNVRMDLNHITRTEITKVENTVGPHSINEVRLKLKDWGGGWELVEELLHESFFEFENSFQLQSFEVLKKQIDLFNGIESIKPYFPYLTTQMVNSVASKFIAYLPYIKSSIHLETLKLLPPLIRNASGAGPVFEGSYDFLDDYFKVIKTINSVDQVGRLKKIVSMGLSIEHNSTYILEGHSFSFFPVALNSPDLISTSLTSPILNQGKKENPFLSERILAKTCSNRVLDFFEFNSSYFSKSGLKIHDFSQFINEFYRTMSQINASPLDLINDLKKIDTGMRRFKYSKLNNETNGWLIVVIKAIYREAIIRQIKNLDTFESSLNVLNETLKSVSAFYGNDLYFFNSYAPKFYFEQVIKDKIDQIIQQNLTSTFPTRHFVTSGALNAIERIAIEAGEKNFEYLIRDHLFSSAYQALRKSIPNKKLAELQTMAKWITEKKNSLANKLFIKKNQTLELQYYHKLILLVEAEIKER